MELNADQLRESEAAREFSLKELRRYGGEMDRTNRLPDGLIPALAGEGLLGIRIPREYGGRGLDLLVRSAVIEELARVSPAVADLVVSVNASVGVIAGYGSGELKDRLLPEIAGGRRIPAYALTEPEAGSDLAAVRTNAVRDGGHFLLQGVKIYVTLAAAADFAVVLAVTDPAAGRKQEGMSLLVAEGFRRSRPYDLMGLRGLAVGGISFRDLRVPAENLVGGENAGFPQIMSSLDGGRVEVAALSVGIARGALDAAVAYAKQREQFGRPLSKFQAVQFMIAEMQTRIDAARLLTRHAARLCDAGRPFRREASEAKLFASETANYCVSESLQIHGKIGYTRGHPVERLYRDAKVMEIFEGTSQIQRIIISREVLEGR